MRTDEELRQRFERVVDGLDTAPGDVARVAARARQRTRRQRVAGAVAGVTVVVAAAVLVPRIGAQTERFTVDPVTTPTAPTSADPTPAEVAGAPPAPDHLRFGAGGVTRHRGEDREELFSLEAQRVIGLADGGAVLQGGTGDPIVRVGSDGVERELLPATRALRLLTVHDGRAWATVRRTDAGGEDEEHLRSVPLDGTAWEDHGVSAGVEGFTDALAFLPGGGAAWLSCHLQCSLVRGDALPSGPGRTTALTEQAGWYAGLAVSPAGDRLALVDGPDPVLGGTSDVVVLDLDGRELGRVQLPVGLSLDTARVEFTVAGDDLVAGDDAHAFVVRDWASDAPTSVGLEGDAGVALLPGPAVLPDAAADAARDLTERGLGWTGAVVGTPQVRDGGTWVPVGVADDRPPTEVLVEELAGELTVTGGGDLAADPEDTSGWWVGVSAEDGRIAIAGHAPTWAPGAMEVSVWSPSDTRTTEIASDREAGPFSVELDVPAQAEDDVVLLFLTREGEVATSFALVRLPAGRFAAG